MAIDLDRILPLRRSNEFPYAKNEMLFIPEVYGNFLDTAAIPSDDVNGGFTPAVCIDQLNLVYAVNAITAVSTAPQVYFNGIGPQAISTYSWDPSNAYQGHSPVATLTFNVNTVLSGDVSIRFGGTVNAQGIPITNPLLGLIDVLTRYAGWTTDDIDWGTVQRSIADLDTLGYPFYWVFHQERTIRDWLLEILPHYHCDFSETGNGKLAIILDRSLTTLAVTPDYHIAAWDIKDFGSPRTAITSEKQLDDLANQITIHARHNWVADQSTHDFVGDFEQSQAAYQAAYPVEFSFRGMYTTAHITQWLNSFVTRHGFEPTVRRLTLHGLKGTPLIPPRLVTVEWPPLGWGQRLLKIRKRITSWARHEVTIECIDCQRELADSADIPNASLTERRASISRVYQWIPGTIGDQGMLEDAPGPGKNEAANGDFELGNNGQWDLRAGTATARWTIEDNAANAYQGRFYARSIQGLPDYNIVTLRRRIDVGEWILVSGWFRDDSVGTDGRGVVIGVFYDINDAFVQLAFGSNVPPTGSYVESLLFAQAPAGSYWFRPGISILPIPTTGAWRADKLVANSGGRGELFAKRLNDLATPNLVTNGDFEAGDIGWTKEAGWYFESFRPRSGTFHMTHASEPTPNQSRRLKPVTIIPVTPGQPFRVQAFWSSLAANGEARMGVFWLDGQGATLSTDSSTALNPPGDPYSYHAWAGTSPTNAVYALPWAECFNHTAGLWYVDDFAVGFSL